MIPHSENSFQKESLKLNLDFSIYTFGHTVNCIAPALSLFRENRNIEGCITQAQPKKWCTLMYLCCLVWWQWWNIIVWQMIFNRFLHPNDLPQRIFWYLIRQLDWRESKMGYFQFLKSIFRPKINLIILKRILVIEYQTKRRTFSNMILSFIHVHQILFTVPAPLKAALEY